MSRRADLVRLGHRFSCSGNSLPELGNNHLASRIAHLAARAVNLTANSFQCRRFARSRDMPSGVALALM